MIRTDEFYRKQLQVFLDNLEECEIKRYFIDLVIKHNQHKNIIENEILKNDIMVSDEEKVKKALRFLKDNGQITHLDIQRECRTTCPHSILRSLKRMLNGRNMTLMENWSKSSKKIMVNGKEKEKTSRYKTYFLVTREVCK